MRAPVQDPQGGWRAVHWDAESFVLLSVVLWDITVLSNAANVRMCGMPAICCLFQYKLIVSVSYRIISAYPKFHPNINSYLFCA